MFSKNIQKIVDLGSIFGGQNGEKSCKHDVEKHAFFERQILSVLFRIFAIWAPFWHVLGPPKIDKKSKKSCSGCLWNAFKIFDCFWNGFGKVCGESWEGFGKVLGGFRKNFRNLLGGVWVKHFKLMNLL